MQELGEGGLITKLVNKGKKVFVTTGVSHASRNRESLKSSFGIIDIYEFNFWVIEAFRVNRNILNDLAIFAEKGKLLPRKQEIEYESEIR